MSSAIDAVDDGWAYHRGADVDLASGAGDDWTAVDGMPSLRWVDDPDLAGATDVWYRTTVAADSASAVGIAAIGAWDLYADGVLVGSDGVVGHAYADFANHAFALPPEVTADGKVELVVHLWVYRRLMPSGGELYDVVAGDPDAVDLWVRAARGDLIDSLWPQFVVMLGSFASGFLAIGLHLRKRGLPGVLSFGVGAVALGCSQALAFVYAGFLPAFLAVRLAMFALPAISHPCLLNSAAQSLGGAKWIVRAVAVAFVVRTIAHGFFPLPMSAFAASTAIVFVPSAIAIAWWVVRGLRTDVPGARVIALTAVLFLLSPAVLVLDAFGALPHGLAERVQAPFDLLSGGALVIGMVWALTVERVFATMGELTDAYAASLRFVPTQFLERVGRRTFREIRRGDAVRERLTVMFLDIRGFTSLAEKHPPEFAFALVNTMLDHVEPLVAARGGFITSYTGDGFAAVFPDADGALASAVDVQRALDRLGRDGITAVPITAGIGLHTGDVLLGTVGGGNYLTVSMVADAVNLAARVEGTTKLYGVRILATSDTMAAARDASVGREVDRVIVKGRRQPIGLFHVLEGADATDASWVAARDHYAGGRFTEAVEAFGRSADYGPAIALQARARELAAAPPVGWDGVWRLDTK
jgi:class 3 adenylate cyclase